MILQDTIDYNDLVNSIQDGALSDNLRSDAQASENKDAKLKDGKVFLPRCTQFVYF